MVISIGFVPVNAVNFGIDESATMTRSLSFIIAFWMSYAVAEAEENGLDPFIGSVPLEIYSVMKEKECSPIPRFHERDIRLPPFVVQRHLGLVAFVCRNDNVAKSGKFRLFVGNIWRKTKSGFGFAPLDECSGEIAFQRMPGGLSIIKHVGGPLQKYNRWGDTGKGLHPKVNDSPKPSWIIKELSNGGVGNGFFCLNGEWHHLTYSEGRD